MTEEETTKAENDTAEAHVVDATPNEVVAPDSSHLVQTDPTVAHAGLTEIDAGTDIALTNGQLNGSSVEEPDAPIPNADVGDNAANSAAENQWDTSNDLATSQEWVQIPKAAEVPQTETAPNAAPAATQSWADDQPEPSPVATTPTDPNDGFQSVQRNRGRGNGEQFRGGRGGHHRGGRGGSGFRGRGRGGGGGGRPWRDASTEQRSVAQRPAARKEAQQS